MASNDCCSHKVTCTMPSATTGAEDKLLPARSIHGSSLAFAYGAQSLPPREPE